GTPTINIDGGGGARNPEAHEVQWRIHLGRRQLLCMPRISVWNMFKASRSAMAFKLPGPQLGH
ncbi:Hypothetical protein FKW44_024339, partial [Caligus rogercresseyi]